MSGLLIGYARASTDEQNLALQLDALEQAGCLTRPGLRDLVASPACARCSD